MLPGIEPCPKFNKAMNKKIIIYLLSLSNVIVACLVIYELSIPIHAVNQIEISDLVHGKIDTDGDRNYDWSDDYVFEWLTKNAPQVLEESVKNGIVVNADGYVDLSPYLKSINSDSIKAK